MVFLRACLEVVIRAANDNFRNLASPFFRSVAPLCSSKMASREPEIYHFRFQSTTSKHALIYVVFALGRRSPLLKLSSIKNMRNIIFLLLIAAILLASCTKEDDGSFLPPPQRCDSTLYARPLTPDTCMDFPDEPVLYFYQRVGLGYGPIGKSADNPDEWFFLINREESSTGNEGSEIWKVDTCSGKKQKLANQAYIQPKLNRNGWILFMNKKDGLLYKIKENGDSLTVVSKEINNITFDWCLDGQAFFYRARFKDVAYLVSIDGTVLDSFAMDCYAIAGQGERVALSLRSDESGSYTKIALLNLLNGELTDMVEIAGMGIGGALALDWESDNTLIAAVGRGLHRINMNSGEVEEIEGDCENLFYYYPVIDPDNTSWLILGKRDYEYPTEFAQVNFTANVVLYNMETGQEWQLELDQ